MASIGEVSSNKVDKEELNENSNLPKKFFFGVFFDGTSNNMIQHAKAKRVYTRLQNKGKGSTAEEADRTMNVHKKELDLSDKGANPIDELQKEKSDFSNVAALHSMYTAMSKQERQDMEKNYRVFIYNVYVHGAGTQEFDSPIIQPFASPEKFVASLAAAAVAKAESSVLGGGFGRGSAGVVALVGNAMNLIQQRINGFEINEEDEIFFDVVGFSRGSACARMFSHAVRGVKDLECRDVFPGLVRGEKFLSKFPENKRKVRFLGIYDTVSSINAIYDNNVTQYGLYSPSDPWVEHTCHICAIDEYRDHFRLTDVGKASDKNAVELLMPGCHSDIGGGYKSGSFTMRVRFTRKRTLSMPSLDKEKLDKAYEDINLIRQMFSFIKPSSIKAMTKPVEMGWLEEMGWYNPNIPGYSYRKDTVNSFYNVTRKLERGYSNIPLNLMLAKGNEFVGMKVFDPEQEASPSPLTRFMVIPDDLKETKNELEGLIKGKTSGRVLYVPPLEKYRKLRSKYIHFTSSDAIVGLHIKTDATLVHGPSVAPDGCITRWVYFGNKGSKGKYDLRKSKECTQLLYANSDPNANEDEFQLVSAPEVSESTFSNVFKENKDAYSNYVFSEKIYDNVYFEYYNPEDFLDEFKKEDRVALTPMMQTLQAINDNYNNTDGFFAHLYYDKKTDTYSLSFRGTEGAWADIDTDAQSNFFCEPNSSLDKVTKLAEEINQLPPEVRSRLTVTGHSLGGGLASLCAVLTNTKCDTFNAMGIPKNLLNHYADIYAENTGLNREDIENNIESQNEYIRAFRTPGDILSKAQKFGHDVRAIPGRIAAVWEASNPLSPLPTTFDIDKYNDKITAEALGKTIIIDPRTDSEKRRDFVSNHIKPTAIPNTIKHSINSHYLRSFLPSQEQED